MKTREDLVHLSTRALKLEIIQILTFPKGVALDACLNHIEMILEIIRSRKRA